MIDRIKACQVSTSPMFTYVTDPAGTPLVMTDSAGSVVWRADYMPFGEETLDVTNVSNNMLFVGKEQDAESGLLYFGARYMDSMAGRFVSPDPVGAVDAGTGKFNEKALMNPQMLNRYVYSMNNPYRFTDPDGNWPQSVHEQIIKKAFSEGQYALTPKAIDAIISASADLDLHHQSSEEQYLHAMRGSNRETVADTSMKAADYIAARETDFRNLIVQGETKEQEAYYALGLAMHLVMDSTSPSHEGYQVYRVFESVRHVRGESEDVFKKNPEYMRRAVELVRGIYDQANH